MTTRVGVAVMALLLALYVVFAVYYATVLFGVGTAVAVGIGVGLLAMVVIGAVFIGVEIAFGVRAERLARRLEAEGGMPTERLPQRASGRIERSAAEELFPQYKAEAEADPENWRAWFRLALVYDASGDRRRARWATREAIRLSR